METSPIYHIVPESEFRARVPKSGLGPETYSPADLADVGFVHCAPRASVVPVANDYFSEVDGAVLLIEIEPSKLSAEVRNEAPAPIEGGGSSHLDSVTEFPHVYGPIDTRAIARVGVLGRTGDGFAWPETFAELAAFLGR